MLVVKILRGTEPLLATSSVAVLRAVAAALARELEGEDEHQVLQLAPREPKP